MSRFALRLAMALSMAAVSWFAGVARAAPENDFADGQALGRAHIDSTVNGVATGANTSELPNYTDQPPQRAYYRSGDLNSPAAQARTDCAARPSDPTCAGVATGQASRPPRTVTLADPALSADGVSRDPTLVLGDIASTYSACTVGTAELVSPAVYERRSCSLQTGTWSPNTCDKTLTVYTRDAFTCLEGTWYERSTGTLPGVGPVAASAYCETTRTDGLMRFRLAVNGQAQEIELDMRRAIPTDGSLPPQVAQLRWDSMMGEGGTWVNVHAEGVGCTPDGNCQMSFHFFEGHQNCVWMGGGGGGLQCDPEVPAAHFEFRHECPAGQIAGNELYFLQDDGTCGCPGCGTCGYVQGDAGTCWAPGGRTQARRIGATEDRLYTRAGPSTDSDAYWIFRSGGALTRVRMNMAKPSVEHLAGDYWDNACAGLEAQTVPLPPDGVNPEQPLAVPVLSGLAQEQCTRSASVCLDGPSTRVIEGIEVFRPCWRWRNTFDCTTLAATSTCTDEAWRSCSQFGQASCIRDDGRGHCLDSQAQFDCKTADAVYQTPLNCGDSEFCAGGSCYDQSYTPDADFAQAITMLEAQRESGRYLDPENMRIFRGTDERCDRELWGLLNCCKPGNTNAFAAFSTLAVAASAVSMVGRAAFSSYTYDGLFTSQAPNWVLTSFEGLFGTGLDSGLMGVLTGNLATADFMMSLVPSPWTAAMLIIQLSGLLECPEDDQHAAMKNDARLCHYVGEYCSSEDIFGGCITETRTHCCYPSRLARIINQQGRPQLSRGWGSPRDPECEGFTIEELQSLDFAAMDLTEFYAEIVPTEADLAELQANAVSQQMECYYGGGACGP